MPKRGLTRKRDSEEQALTVSSGASKQRELAKLVEDRPDKPILIRVRKQFLERVESEFENLWKNYTDVMEGRGPETQVALLEGVIESLKSVKDDDLQVRRNLALAALNLSDAAKMQTSRATILVKMLDKLLIDTRESENTQNGDGSGGPSGLFKGANINISVGSGVKRGLAAKNVTPAAA